MARRTSTRTHSKVSSHVSSRLGRSQYRRRLRLEALEDRRLLAVVTVTTLADTVDFNDGVTSLREAIFAANTVPGADTIEFDPALFAEGPGTILLTQGELRIIDSLAIEGPGAELLTVDASGNDPTPDQNNNDGSRIFNVLPTAVGLETTFAGLTLTGGDVALGLGGAILAPSTADLVRVIDCVIRENSGFYGGGIYANYLEIVRTTMSDNHAGAGGAIIGGEMTIIDSTFRQNTATYSGGAIEYGGSANIIGSEFSLNSAGSDGGAIRAFGNLSIRESIVSGSRAGTNGGAIYHGGAGIFEVSDSQLSSNSALGSVGVTVGRGGAIFARRDIAILNSTVADSFAQRGGGIYSDGSVQINDSFVSGNTATNAGGGVYSRGTVNIASSTIKDNWAGVYGGGIHSSTRKVTVHYSNIERNSAVVGGGISIGAFGGNAVTIENSTIIGNQATNVGGGIWNNSSTGNLVVQRSTISDNTAGTGGGIHFGGDVLVANSTISGNSASSRGGAIVAFGRTGTLWSIRHSTITNNSSASSAGGILVLSGALELDHTIVAANSAPVGRDLARQAGTVTSEYSLIGYDDTNGT